MDPDSEDVSDERRGGTTTTTATTTTTTTTTISADVGARRRFRRRRRPAGSARRVPILGGSGGGKGRRPRRRACRLRPTTSSTAPLSSRPVVSVVAILASLPLLLLLSTLVTSVSAQSILGSDRSDVDDVDVDVDAAPRQCVVSPRPPDPKRKSLYRVGVLAIRGFDAAYREFNRTFSDYLTESAGRRFDPPVSFLLEPLNFVKLFAHAEDGYVDFIYVNPSAFSCIESQYGAHSLVSQISRRVVGGNVYHLTKFGGVIFARADNDEVEAVRDIKGRSFAAASISGLGSGQMQFRVLQKAGLSYINDPSQVVFTSNQGKVVNGVLRGEFDVGFVRTDQIERTKDDSTGEPVDGDLLKIIEPLPGLNIEGEPFPFRASTPLYPEWNVAALPSVPDDVAREVQAAMLALSDHADVGKVIDGCLRSANCTGRGADEEDLCREECVAAAGTTVLASGGPSRCDTTADLALLALDARTKGKYAGWRSVLSYMELRNMQEETGFISRDPETGEMRCVRSAEIYEAIVCPPGHFKKTKEEVLSGCADAGLPCKDGFQCVCSPCVRAYDVDVFPLQTGLAVADASRPGRGCAKMALCGTTEQRKPIAIRAVDNRERDGERIWANIHEGDRTRKIEARAVEPTAGNATSFLYEFEVTATKVGVVILEIYAGDEQIPESPLRIEVKPRDCVSDMSDPLSVPLEDGTCHCAANAVAMGNRCVSYSILMPSILVPICFLVAVLVYLYVDNKRRQADSVWSVKTSELRFDDPPVIVGRGTFGLVLLAEYRGTQVAVKRVIPPRVTSKDGKVIKKDSTFGKGEESSDLESGILMHDAQPAYDAKDAGDSGNYVKHNKNTARRKMSDFFEMDNNQVKELEIMETGKVIRRASLSGSLPDHDNLGHGSGGHVSLSNEGLRSWGNKSGAGPLDSMAMSSGTISGVMKSQAMSTTWRKQFETRLRKRDEYSRLKADFIVEMRYLSKLRHPCITTVMGAVISRRDEPMLVMEYMDHGSLYDLLHNNTVFIEGDLLLPILRDIAQGVRFLHAATPQVIHGDLKAQNVLVDSKFRAKVADFGLSQKKQVGATGTPFWMAPELLRGDSDNSDKSDVYSFGIILYEVYSRKEPYESEDPREVLRLVADHAVNKRPPIPPAMPPVVASLMQDCLVAEAENRPTSEELDLRLKRLDVSCVEPGNLTSSYQKSESMNAMNSEKLLYEMFPKHIADALREGRRVEPENKECVTIYFSDIVGFTTISSMLSPMKVSNMLDRLYQRFDDLSRKYEVHKLETIGDAWLGVTNLMKDQPDHTKRIAEFSVATIEAAKATEIDLEDPTQGVVQIRVGFHSGPVVADVIGSRTPKYSLFGDTVNTSSRMESNSLPGRIQCSERSAALVRKQHPTMPIRKRGKIKVKGKGEMRTFWVNEVPISRHNSTGSSQSSLGSDAGDNDLGIMTKSITHNTLDAVKEENAPEYSLTSKQRSQRSSLNGSQCSGFNGSP